MEMRSGLLSNELITSEEQEEVGSLGQRLDFMN